MGKARTAAREALGLEEDLKRQLAESKEQRSAISEILQVISASPASLERVFASIAESSARLCRADGCVIWLLDGEVLRYAGGTASGETVDYMRTLVLGPGLYGPGLVLSEGKSNHEVDIRRNPAVDAEMKERFATRSALSVPLRRAGSLLGVLVLARHRVEAFTAPQIALAETFAVQAAIAIENVRLFNETKEALEQQTATADVLKVISRSAFDLRPVLEAVVQTAGRIAKADGAWIRRQENDRFLPFEEPSYAFWGATPEIADQLTGFFVRRDPALRQLEGGSIMALAARERRTIHEPDVSTREETKGSPGVVAIGGRTALAVPLLRQDLVVGQLVLARVGVEPFTDREIRLVETFADQAAIAIENVRLFGEIQEKSAELAAASQHKSEFLANMSHELRTPLNAIIGFSEVLADGMVGPLGDKQREYLEDIRSSGQHLLSLINDVLDLSKVEAGRMELDLGEVSVASVVDEALLLIRERASRHGITIAAEVPADLPPLTADGRKLKQVVLNLVTNAVKFTPDGGWVGVIARQEADDLVVVVRDTGVGIAPDDQTRIFEEFRQAKRRDGSVEGTGLGLSLTKKIVELHGGRISVESELGTGSTFTARLPLRPAAVTVQT